MAKYASRPACPEAGRRHVLVVVGGFALFLAACGQSGTESSAPDAGGPSSSGGSSGGDASSGDDARSGTSSSGGVSGSGASSGGSSGGGGGDAGTSTGDAGACGASENPATCNSINPTGPMVQTTCISAEPPQPQGGTIEDGTYALQTFTLYGACLTPQAFASTWGVCQDHWDFGQISADLDGGPPAGNANFTATVQGTTVSFTTMCTHLVSAPPMISRGYTATPGHLRFVYDYQPGTTAVGEYVKQ